MTDGSASPGSGGSDLVRVSRSGGFAGLTLSGEVDLDRLAEPERAAWDQALQESLARSPVSGPTPDRYVYRVSRPAVGFEVTIGERELTDDVRTLLDRAVLPDPPPT